MKSSTASRQVSSKKKDPVASNKPSKAVPLDLRMIGAALSVESLAVLIGWILAQKALTGPNGLQSVPSLQSDMRSHVVCFVLSGLALLLGVGLFVWQGYSGKLCAVLALLLLGASSFSTYTYFRTASALTSTQKLYTSQMQQLSEQYLENAAIAPSVRTGEARQVVETAIREQQADAKHKRILVPLVEDYLLAIVILWIACLPRLAQRYSRRAGT